MAEHEATEPLGEGTMGTRAAEYEDLRPPESGEATPSAREFYAELAEGLDDVPGLKQAVTDRATLAPDRLWSGPEEKGTGTWKGDRSEAEARSLVQDAVRIAARFLRTTEKTGSPTSGTMADLRTDDDFDQVVAGELMLLFGAAGRQYGYTEPDKLQPDRFETTTYYTKLPNYTLQAWRHNPGAQALRETDRDMVKFSLHRMD